MSHNLPWFPFFVGDYLKATAHLKPQQDGALLRLMMAMWTSDDCTVPNDVEALRMITRLPPRRFVQMIGPVLDLLVLEGDKLTHLALREEFYRGVAISARNTAKAVLGGMARAATAPRHYNGRFAPTSSRSFPKKISGRVQPTHQDNHISNKGNGEPPSLPDGSVGSQPDKNLADALERLKACRRSPTGDRNTDDAQS